MTALNERRKEFRLEWRETPERLDRMATWESAAVLQYGDYFLVAGWYYNGIEEDNWYAAIYEVIDEFSGPETDLGLEEISPGFFPDPGHAIEWALNALE